MANFVSDIILGAELLNGNGFFNADAMRDALNAVKETEHARYIDVSPADRFDDDELHALAAAVEYFGADISDAIAAIERGDYRHYPDVFTYEELGNEIAIDTMGGRYLPQLIADYLDTEILGEDTANGERGQFTRFGYFAPEV